MDRLLQNGSAPLSRDKQEYELRSSAISRIANITRILPCARQSNGPNFLTAAGCLAHYVGDSCQPLHSSQHSDGLNGASTGVHSTYEDNMVNAYADKIAAGIAAAIAKLTFKPRKISTAWDAAMAVMDLMNFCHQALPQRPFVAFTTRHGPAPARAPRQTQPFSKPYGITAVTLPLRSSPPEPSLSLPFGKPPGRFLELPPAFIGSLALTTVLTT